VLLLNGDHLISLPLGVEPVRPLLEPTEDHGAE
jgi:hypothetical protein